MNDPSNYFLIGLAFLGGMLAMWRYRNEQNNALNVPKQAVSPGPELQAEIDQLLAAGKKIEAIKALQKCTGLDLKAAKDLIERAERTGVPVEVQSNPSLAATSTNPQVSAPVMAFLREGKKIEAIKQLREETGLGLAEAKSIIDRVS